MIRVDIRLLPVNNTRVEPKLDPDNEIDFVPVNSGGVHHYSLVGDIERLVKPPERCGYEDLIAYGLLTSFGDAHFLRGYN